MTEKFQANNINKVSLIHGLLISAIVIALSVVFRVIDPLIQFTNIWVGLIPFVTVIALMTILGLDVRRKLGGFWSFGDAFKSLMLMGVVIAMISTAYNFVIFKFVDPTLPEKANAVMLDNMTTRLTSSGLDADKIDQYTKTFKNGEFIAKLQPTLLNELIAIGSSLILYAVISLIIAACIKKKAPFFIDPEPSL